MIWAFAWLLIAGGSQFSQSYPTQAKCEAARQVVERTHISPYGKPVEKTFVCTRMK